MLERVTTILRNNELHTLRNILLNGEITPKIFFGEYNLLGHIIFKKVLTREILQIFIECGWSIDVACCKWGRETPFITAALWSDRNAMNLLVDAGLNPNYQSGKSISPFWILMYRSEKDFFYSDIIAKLLRNGADPNLADSVEPHPMYPLYLAVERECMQLVEVLLKAGADPHARNDKELITAYQLASRKNLIDICSLLEKAMQKKRPNSEPRLERDSLQDALTNAIISGDIARANKFLSVLNQIYKQEKLLQALNVTCPYQVKSIIDYKSQADFTALYFAVSHGHSSLLPQILTLDVDINRVFAGSSLIMVSLSQNKGEKQLQCFNILFENAADLTYVDPNGDNILHYAVRFGSEEIVKKLLTKGVPQIKNAKDQTPWVIAKELNNEGMLKLLTPPPIENNRLFAAKPDNEVPEDFYCPLTHEVMRDPVILPDKISYERKAIVEWLSKNNISPVSRKEFPKNLQVEELITENLTLRNLIAAFFKRRPKLAEEEGYKEREIPDLQRAPKK